MAWLPRLSARFRSFASTVEVDQEAGQFTGRIRLVGDHRMTGIPSIVAAAGTTVGDLPGGADPGDDPNDPVESIPWTAEQRRAILDGYVLSNRSGVVVTLEPWQTDLWAAGEVSWQFTEDTRFRLPTSFDAFVKQYGDIAADLWAEGLIPRTWAERLGLTADERGARGG